MIQNSIRYIISGGAIIILAAVLVETVILPQYVGANEELYLPDVRGMFKHHAVKKLHSQGLLVKIEDIPFTNEYEIGRVLKMSPLPPIKIKSGRLVELSVPSGRNNIFVPELVNLSLRNAMIEIEKNNLVLDTVMYEHFSETNKGLITVQNPRAGHLVETGALVSLMVSKGPPPDIFRVPDLINLSLNRARQRLQDVGLRLGNIEYEYQPGLLNGTVVEQSLTPGMSVSIPAAVDIIVSSSKIEEDQ